MAIGSKYFVQYILEHADDFKWTLQGFGMLRTYIGKDMRLNIWDSRFAVPDVSTIHNHPWHFDSEIVVGRLINKRYIRHNGNCTNYMEQTIKCGEGGGPCGAPKPEYLLGMPVEIYNAGDVYHQESHEIHESLPDMGTVTLNSRDRLSDPDHASVFWPLDKTWVSAEPREATEHEINSIIYNSLVHWF